MSRNLEQRVHERTAQLEALNEELADRERALRQAQANLEDLLSESPVVMLRGDTRERTFSYFSPNFTRVFGYAQSDAIGKPAFISQIVHPDDLEQFRSTFQQWLNERRSRQELEFRLRRKDGNYRLVHALLRFDASAEGSDVALRMYLTDITERREVQAALEEAKLESERANSAKNEFLSRMSHELRTPLNAILGFGELLELDNRSEKEREYLRFILGAGRHLLDLINEVLDIARIEANRMTLSVEPVPVCQVLSEAIALIRPAAAQRGIDIQANESAVDQHVVADQQRLKQVILNLLANAVKYNREGGSIGVTCEEHGKGRVRISVRDTGFGIPPEKFDRLFTPFERLGAETSEIEGTGLGLALSKRLMEAMHGTIGAESTVGEGSTFWLQLPAAHAPVQEWVAPVLPPESVADPHTQRTLLYVEDNLSNLRLVESILERRPWITLLAAMQGGLGLELARDHLPDLILLDLHLPDIAGDEVLRRLLEDPKTAGTPIVIISADATANQVQRLLAAGARTYLTKPLNVRKFLDLVDQLLETPALAL